MQSFPDWHQNFSPQAALLRPSPVREFLQLAALPGMISFSGGLPAPELFPVTAVQNAAHQVLSHFSAHALQYSQTEGIFPLRQWLVHYWRSKGVQLHPENVLITNGAQQALDLLGRTLLAPGNLALFPDPTYLSVLSAWRPSGARLSGLTSDQEGIVPTDLSKRAPEKPKILYLTPNFNNPDGTTLSLARRQQLLDLALQHRIMLIEDDPYADLRYEGTPSPSMLQMIATSEGNVIHVGTVSKILAPAFRVGWIIGPRKLISTLSLAKQLADLNGSAFNQYLVWHLLESGLLKTHLPILCAEYALRRNIALEALQGSMPPGVQWTHPAGGMFLLLRLPPHLHGREVARKALQRQVIVVPGADFHFQGGSNTIRINFTHPRPEEIRAGVSHLTFTLKEMLDSLPQELQANS